MKLQVKTVYGDFLIPRQALARVMDTDQRITKIDKRQIVNAVDFFTKSGIKPCDIHYKNGTIVTFIKD